MSTPKALREAKAAIAAIEGQAKELRARIAAAKAIRDPLYAKLQSIRKRRDRVRTIKFLAGQYYVGPLSVVTAELNVKDLKATPKAVLEALESGALKIRAGGYGQSYSLKGLVPRIRIVDPSTFRVYERTVKARQRSEAALAKARSIESAAFAEAYKAGPKVTRESLAAGIVEDAVAQLRLNAVEHPDRIIGELGRLINPEYSRLAIAKAHLAFVQSGSTEACPCAGCAQARRDATETAEIVAHLATLPKLLLTCPTHERRARMPWEHVKRRLDQAEFERLGLAAYGLTWAADYWADHTYVLPIATCPGGDRLVVNAILESEAKARAKAAKAA